MRLQKGGKSQNQEYLWKKWVKTVGTWHQHGALRNAQDGSYRDAATVAPVPFCFITKCCRLLLFNEKRWSCSKTTQCPYCAKFFHEPLRSGRCL